MGSFKMIPEPSICPASTYTHSDTHTLNGPWITSVLIVLALPHGQSVRLASPAWAQKCERVNEQAYPPWKVLEKRLTACKSSVSLSSELSLSSDNGRCLGYSRGDMIYQGGEWLCEALRTHAPERTKRWSHIISWNMQRVVHGCPWKITTWRHCG